jgi:dihydroorotase
MNILIKAATILDPTSPFHKKQLDIYIHNGTIKEIGKNLSYPKAQQVNFKNLHVSQGWFDSSVSFGEPGYEERETIDNGLQVAALSGFTHIAYNTNTTPKPDSRADISFLLELASGHVTQLHPKACITTNADKLAPLRELHAAGAVSFSNHKQSISNGNALKLALQYSNDFNGLVESFAFDKDLANDGIMHEGAVSTALGLNGIPSVVEEVQLKRDLGILEYALGKLHTPTLSTSTSVKLIKEAKKLGLNVSCSVSIFNLFFNDEALQGFNPNAKLLPPLRRNDDQKALKKALADGIIDMVTADHQPLNSELKNMELDRAHFGSIGLEHSFGSLLRHFSIEETAEILTRGKARFGIREYPIEVGTVADLSLFTDEGSIEVCTSSIRSFSKNSLFIGETLPGKVLGVIRGDKAFLQDA